jgi:hypothetical protein
MRTGSSLRGRPGLGAFFVLPLLAACGQAPAEPGEAAPGANARESSPAAAPQAAPTRPVAISAAEREAQARTLGAAIKPQVDRSPGAAKVTATPGGKHAELGGGYQSVVIAKVNNDGSRSTTCVDDEREAEAFWRTGEAPAKKAGDQ